MVVIDTTTDDGSSTQVGSQTRLRKYWQPMLRAPKPKPHTISSFLSRNGSVLVLALMASGMFSWTAFYAYTYTNHPRELPVREAEGSGQSVIVLQVSTSVTALLLGELVHACFERVRWEQASSTKGILGGSLMGLSRGTSTAGVLYLLVHPATRWSTRLWCFNRLLVYVMIFVITFILLLDLSFPTISLVAVDWDPSLVVTTGLGDFNDSVLQQDILGFPGFLGNPSSTLAVPPSLARCNDVGTDDTSLDQCESHLLFTGLSNIQSWSQKQVSLIKTPAFQEGSSIASGFMPWIETPLAVSFYEHAFNHSFIDGVECNSFTTPILSSTMDDEDQGEDDEDFWPAPSWDYGADQVGVKMCVSTLNSSVSSGTTVVMEVGVCIGAECFGAENFGHGKRMPPPGLGVMMFHGPEDAPEPLSLSMTITKWYATPVYSTQNGTVLSADLPVYTIKGTNSNSVLQDLEIDPTSLLSALSEPIPVSIQPDSLRNYLQKPFIDAEHYGNRTVRYTLPNVLLNQIVGSFTTGDSSDAYTLMKDFLAYSFREASIPSSGSTPNISPSLWSWQQSRMQISLPAWYSFVALSAAVILSCFVIIVWTSIADRASSTTLYPEVDFGAGFMASHGHERDHGYNTTVASTSNTSTTAYDGLPGYEDVTDRRNWSDDDFMTHTQEQIDLVSKLRKVDSGRVVHRMARATFKVADPS